jgi:hypothetical protein
MKCYIELACDNVETIAEEIYTFIKNKTDILQTKEYGWHFINCNELLKSAPELLDFFRKKKLIPYHAAITIVTNSLHLQKHIDELPVVAKINIPVRNTVGWANRWYDGENVIAELYDMKLPIVFNSQVAHSVDKIKKTKLPRLVASFTFHNEPIKWLE